jgi:DinB superfamily
MSVPRLAGPVLEAWKDLDRVLAGLSSEEAVARPEGRESFAWTLGHVSQQVDSWINVNFAGRKPNSLLSEERFRRGSVGASTDWQGIVRATREVRTAADNFLRQQKEADLERRIPYNGSLIELKEHGLTLRYALTRITFHHYFHIGVVACQRSALGQSTGDFPGLLAECF